MNKTGTLIIAHRGESFDAPENTMAAINLAWQRNAAAVEIDVHLSKDNNIVVMHDSNTKRTTGRNKKISSQTLEQLKELDAGSWKDEKWKNEKIPTLPEVLRCIPKNKKLIIEIKTGKKIIPFLKNDINNSNILHKQIEFISFGYKTMVEIKKHFPKNKALYLVDLDYTWLTKLLSPPTEKLIEQTKKGNLNGLNVWAGKLLNKEFIGKVKSAGLLLYVWTVDNPFKAKQLFNWGVDAVTTNKAGWLRLQIFND